MRERIADVRASIVARGPNDQAERPDSHWINGEIATPMSVHPAYRATRTSFGMDFPGSFVVEVESDSGQIGVAVSTGGVAGCWVVERHLRRFLVGAQLDAIETIWDQMWRATLHYGRKGLVVNAISAVDLALWDLLGRVRQEPVFSLIGGAVREAIPLYATGPRPDLAQQLGFIGGKLPLVHGPASGSQGLRQNTQLFQDMRGRVGDSFFLAYDCWMALDLDYAVTLAEELSPYDPRWIEECLPPDDYWGYAELRRRIAGSTLLATGEHEAGRLGFRLLLEMGCCDIIQPDVTWCGGMTELLKIAALAEAFGVPVIPHSSSVFSYHFVVTQPRSEFAEFLMMSEAGDQPVPIYAPLLIGEPMPAEGSIQLADRPGFGVELNREIELHRPYAGATG